MSFGDNTWTTTRHNQRLAAAIAAGQRKQARVLTRKNELLARHHQRSLLSRGHIGAATDVTRAPTMMGGG